MLLICISCSSHFQSRENVITLHFKEKVILFSWLISMFNGMNNLEKTVQGFSLELRYIFAPLSCMSLNMNMARHRLQKHITMLEFSFQIPHAINNHYTFVTSGLLEVLLKECSYVHKKEWKISVAYIYTKKIGILAVMNGCCWCCFVWASFILHCL